MNWLYVNALLGNGQKKVLVNINTVQDVYYDEDTDLTVIDFTRAAYPSLYVKGDIMIDIKRLINSHGFVSQIGG